VPTAALAAALAAAPTRLVVFTHASNVTGAVLDAAAIVAVSRAAGAWSVVDASQTAGWLDLRCDADVVVASAHKALQGPPGLGFVALRPGRELLPQKQGGTGSGRTEAVHPVAWPAAFEAGTPNTPAILGLGAALDGVATPATQAAALQRALARVDQLALGLADDPRWRLLPPTSSLRTPILSLVPRDYEPSELGAILADADVHVRSGFHCAPWIHAHLGTVAGGTVRISPGADTTAADIDRVLALLHRL
jgi:selenocysteine lyase/cysteine desulfurase